MKKVHKRAVKGRNGHLCGNDDFDFKNQHCCSFLWEPVTCQRCVSLRGKHSQEEILKSWATGEALNDD